LANHITWRGFVNDLNPRNYAINVDFWAFRNQASIQKRAFSIQLYYLFSLMRKTPDGQVEKIYDKLQEKLTIECREVDQDDLDSKNHWRRYCNTGEILHFNEIKSGDYEIVFQFIDISVLNELIEKFRFSATTWNTDFIVFMIFTRYFFFFVSLITAALYYKNVGGTRTNNRCFEQGQIWYLSILLPLSNDPLAWVNMLWPNLLTLFVSCLFAGIFIGSILLFWLTMLHRIINEQNNSGSKELTIWKKVFVLVRFFLTMK
jgi:hypothetical protein